ncbi:MAG: AsmA family protein [Alphaproteobacteria bacterium]|nr:AsmA family protein [Alphaproteobacteria bacterium]
MKNKKQLFIFIVRACVLFFGILSVSLIIALTQVDLETLRQDITASMRATTGMPVEIRGAVSWKFSLRPRVTLKDVVIPNAEWARNENGVQIDEVIATLDLISVFRNRPVIQNVRMIGMRVFLEQNSAGAWSIALDQSALSREPEPGAIPYDIDIGLESLELVNPIVTVIKRGGQESWTVHALKIKYKRTDTRVEYSGYLEKEGERYSFIATISELDTERRVFPLRIAIASRTTPVVINAALEGTSHIPIDFILRGTVSNPRALGSLFNLDLPDIPKFDINVNGGFGHSTLTIHRSSITMGNNDLNISGNIDWRQRKPRLSVTLRSNNINLREIYPALYAPEDPPWVHPGRPLNVFKDVPLYSNLLGLFDGDINLDMKNITVYRELKVSNIVSNINIRDSEMNVGFAASVGGGDISAALAAQDIDGVLYAKGAGQGSGIVAGNIMEQLRENNIISGLPTSFMFYLESRGYDLSEFMSNITGPIKIWSTGAGRALEDMAEYFYGRDFLTAVRQSVTDTVTRSNRHDTLRINCAAVNVKFRDGRMETERGVAIETTEVNIRATGFVDLGRETLNASIVTTPVRGLRISFSGNVVNSMEFTGNMAEPDLRVNRNAVVGRAVAATGVGILLAPFTGGLSIAAGAGVGFLTSDLLKNWLADDNPCRTAKSERGAPSRPGDPAFLNKPLEDLIKTKLQD